MNIGKPALKFIINKLPPSLNVMYRKSKYGAIYKTLKARQYIDLVHQTIKEQNENIEILNCNVKVTIIMYQNDKRKRDIDNVLKVLLDAMNGIVYIDDSQIIELHIKKVCNTQINKIEIEISELANIQ
jgi:crossover junction endodeoxyribonuclease RusA